VLYDTTTAPPVDCATVALAELDSELPATAPVPEVVDDVGARVFIPVDIAGDVVVTGSEEIDVGMAMETAVAFPAVRSEAGMVASGDAVKGSLKMSQISAMA
jgi:hypothetical protein